MGSTVAAVTAVGVDACVGTGVFVAGSVGTGVLVAAAVGITVAGGCVAAITAVCVGLISTVGVQPVNNSNSPIKPNKITANFVILRSDLPA